MMRTRDILLFLGAMFLFASCVNEGDMNVVQTPSTEESYSAGEILVKFSPEVASMLEEAGVVRSNVTRSGVGSVDELLDFIEGFELSRVFPVDMRHEERTVRDGLNCWYVVRYRGDYTTEDVARRFAQLGEVQKTDVNRTIKRANTRKAIPLSKFLQEKNSLQKEYLLR